MPRYRYSSLNEKAGEIRLLTLLPPTFSKYVRILLHTTPLTNNNTPVFEALSYTWGSSDNPVSIAVGQSGQKSSLSSRIWPNTLPVTQNLATALRCLRCKDKPRVLWIDAVCVDQQNLDERSQQVQRMSDIYKSADRVVVWLGPEGDNSAFALKIMDDLSSKIEVDWLALAIKPTNESDAQWADRAIPLPYGAEEMLAIYHLLSRPWFERLWIRQEIRLANSKAILTCGLNTIKWQSFRKTIFCLRIKKRRRHLLGPNYLPFLDRLKLVYNLSSVSAYFSFSQLMRQTSHCKCSDPKDRVYALLSILDPREQDVGIKPDYSKTTSQVYEDTVLQFITRFGDLLILTSCQMRDDRSPSMPTWVPDWSVGNTTTPIRRDWASGNSPSDAIYLGHGILKVTGVHSTTISHVENIRFTSPSSKLMEEIRRLAPPGIMQRPYRGGGTLFDAYCRALCADHFRARYSPPLQLLPGLEESRDALHCILAGTEVSVATGSAAFKYLNEVSAYCKGRSFFTTDEGYIGLAPKAAQPGDQIAVLLGCPSPMLLRQNGARHQVVGECYVHGLMNGEVLLGVLPSRYQIALVMNVEVSAHQIGFLDLETGLTQYDDPRLDAMGYGPEEGRSRWTSRDKQAKYKWPKWLIPKVLEEIGVELRNFELE